MVDAGDFVLPVDKAEGPTSHDVVAAARRALGVRRLGHTGTLDPFASGLLLLCVGRATRLAEYLSGLDKGYVAEAWLGVETDTLDREGQVVSECDGWRTLTDQEVAAALGSFVGAVDQVPPQFSAKKVGGEAMYRKARRGERVALAPVRVTIHGVELLSLDLPRVRFCVRCSTGTYVRAVARDLGTALGVGAHLTELRRISVGSFGVEHAVGSGDLDDAGSVGRSRIEPLAALGHLARVDVGGDDAQRLRDGRPIGVGSATLARPTGAWDDVDGQSVAVAHEGDLWAIAQLSDGILRPRKVFAS